MLLQIGGVTVDVIEGANIELEKEGGVEGYFGSQTGKHAVGMNRATFSIRRWLVDNTDPDLIIDLFDDELSFSLSGQIDGVANTTLLLTDCRVYRYRWVMGGVNDIAAEEGTGEASGWDKSSFNP